MWRVFFHYHAWDFATTLAAWAAFFVLERLFPARPQSLRQTVFNVTYFAGYYVFLMASAFGIDHLLDAVYRARDAARATPWLSETLTPGTRVLHFVVYFLVVDLLAYWRHRAMHQVGWLWRFHLLHHSDTEMNATTGRLDHWLNEAFYTAGVMLPVAILFGPFEAPLVVVHVYVFYAFFNHANLRLDLGLFTPVFAGPQWHRIHHSREPQHHFKNFASFFPIWDIAFGTYCRPQPDEYPATGLASGRRVTTLMDAHFGPFGWRPRASSAVRAQS